MKPSNALQEEFAEKIYKLVMDGFYDAGPLERGARFETLFYGEYETLLCDMQMTALPLEYRREENRFQILPQFWENTTDLAMSSYYKIFYQRYRDMFIEKQEEPDFDEDETMQLMSVDYRTTNEDYAQMALKEMMGESFEQNEKIDGYGWIENRKQFFYEFMDELCDTYKLPRLPINFNTEDHKPRFAVPEQEDKNFRTMLSSRMKIQEEYAVVEYERTMRLERLKESELSKEEKEQREKEINFHRSRKIDKIFDKVEGQWLEENQQSHFPSRLDFYPIEIVRQIDENKDCTLRFNQTINSKDDFMAYLPFRPLPPKNDFLSN